MNGTSKSPPTQPGEIRRWNPLSGQSSASPRPSSWRRYNGSSRLPKTTVTHLCEHPSLGLCPHCERGVGEADRRGDQCHGNVATKKKLDPFGGGLERLVERLERKPRLSSGGSQRAYSASLMRLRSEGWQPAPVWRHARGAFVRHPVPIPASAPRSGRRRRLRLQESKTICEPDRTRNERTARPGSNPGAGPKTIRE